MDIFTLVLSITYCCAKVVFVRLSKRPCSNNSTHALHNDAKSYFSFINSILNSKLKSKNKLVKWQLSKFAVAFWRIFLDMLILYHCATGQVQPRNFTRDKWAWPAMLIFLFYLSQQDKHYNSHSISCLSTLVHSKMQTTF